MADLDPGGFDMNQPLPIVGDDHEVTRPAVVLVDPDPGGFDSNQPQPVVEDDHEVRRPAVQVYISNPFDWDEVQDDLFDVNNPIFSKTMEKVGLLLVVFVYFYITAWCH
jgi:hypothetical protein